MGLNVLDRFLTVWILLIMVIGVLIGYFSPGSSEYINSQSRGGTNIMVAVGLIVMMFPPFTSVDYTACLKLLLSQGTLVPIIVSFIFNWIVGPIVMFGFATLTLFDRPEYMRGLILVGLARCIAMVVVWNRLAGGSAELATMLVGLNSIFQIVFFSLYATFFVSYLPTACGLPGVQVQVPIRTIAESVAIYLGIPFLLGFSLRWILHRVSLSDTVKTKIFLLLSKLTLLGLLFTILVIFILKGATFIQIPLDVLRILPGLILYFGCMFGINFYVGWKLKWSYTETVTVSFTSASNNFELAIAVAIAVFGLHSGEAFATVIGPLVEVPVMLLLVNVALHLKKYWQQEPNEDDFVATEFELPIVSDQDQAIFHPSQKNELTPVVFVCVANSCRSQMAEGFFNALAQGTKKLYRAQSAGTKASGIVNPTAIQVMKEIGIDISHHTSKSITQEEMKQFKYVISMGCADKDACPRSKGCTHRDWGIEDPVGQSIVIFRQVRDKIRTCVAALVDELETGIPSKCCS